jgi:hypothetical protein
MWAKNHVENSFYSAKRVNSKVSHTNIFYSLVMNLVWIVIFLYMEVFMPKFAQQEHSKRYINTLFPLVTSTFPKEDFNLINY